MATDIPSARQLTMCAWAHLLAFRRETLLYGRHAQASRTAALPMPSAHWSDGPITAFTLCLVRAYGRRTVVFICAAVFPCHTSSESERANAARVRRLSFCVGGARRPAGRLRDAGVCPSFSAPLWHTAGRIPLTQRVRKRRRTTLALRPS